MDHSPNREQSAIELIGHRGPMFRINEIKVLVNLVEKYKTVVLNKNTNAASINAKDRVWAKITKEFNEGDVKHTRSVESLKTKWENLKKVARRASKNIIDLNYNEFDEITNRVVSMIHEADNRVEPIECASFLDDCDNEIKENSMNYWEDDKSSDEDSARELDRKARSTNFSPQECDLLLKCVKQEKDIIFSRETTKKANDLKSLAWTRIVEEFNKYSTNARSKRVLRTKFENMKKIMKKASVDEYIKRFGSGLDLDNRPFKSEPLFENKMDDEDLDDIDRSDLRTSPLQNNDDCIDPLQFVMNADSGIGSTSYMAPWNEFENKEVVKLKLELLNYQLETAKLKRKRLEEAIRAEVAEREAKSLETSLRLRTARLEAVAAEMKLPETHPALVYTEKEKLAQEYLKSH
ncbi:myb/SANT-like DNA-binding domain-containing protein 4 isoform X2 [Colias croceus]|uniref:myb/SANT-like DNA-binding domain-containing protein 4 isoform X2 n=1 Tax=Colias crocea TaxID=72248 RepID=UPI001E28006B|nr:myb/SANT-like DNA-binding domain-containing protein 4 isoform X2 [Colias croceus]